MSDIATTNLLGILSIVAAAVSITLGIVALAHTSVQHRETASLQRQMHEVLATVTERVERVAAHSSRQVDRAWEYVTNSSRPNTEQHTQQDEAQRTALNQDIVQTVVRVLRDRQIQEFSSPAAEDELLTECLRRNRHIRISQTRLRAKIHAVDRALWKMLARNAMSLITKRKTAHSTHLPGSTARIQGRHHYDESAKRTKRRRYARLVFLKPPSKWTTC